MINGGLGFRTIWEGTEIVYSIVVIFTAAMRDILVNFWAKYEGPVVFETVYSATFLFQEVLCIFKTMWLPGMGKCLRYVLTYLSWV